VWLINRAYLPIINTMAVEFFFNLFFPFRIVDVFFKEERLPIEEGWKRSAYPITTEIMLALTNAIAGGSDWTPGPGVTSPVYAVRVNETVTITF
jgi:hypothetical protein